MKFRFTGLVFFLCYSITLTNLIAEHMFPRPESDSTDITGSVNFGDFKSSFKAKKLRLKLDPANVENNPIILQKETALDVEGLQWMTPTRLSDRQEELKISDKDVRYKFLEVEDLRAALNAEIPESDTDAWLTDGEEKPYKKGKSESGNPRFNGHAYTLGESIGLTPKDWVERGDKQIVTFDEKTGKPIDLFDGTNAMDLLLKKYYRIVRLERLVPPTADNPGIKNYRGPAQPGETLEVQKGDIVVFTGNPKTWATESKFQPELPRIQHVFSGRIVEVKMSDDKAYYTKIQVQGKIGETLPILSTTVKEFGRYFWGSWNEVRYYRLKTKLD